MKVFPNFHIIWLGGFILWGSLLSWFPAELAAQAGGSNRYGARIGNINIQNREQTNAIKPIYGEFNYHVVLPNNEGYEMVAQVGHAAFAFKRREFNQDFQHEYQMALAQLSFLANERDGFDLYYGAGGGVGTYNRRSRVVRGNLTGTRTPHSTGTFISYHATIGIGYYSGGSGLTLDFDYANWGGLFVIVGALGYVF